MERGPSSNRGPPPQAQTADAAIGEDAQAGVGPGLRGGVAVELRLEYVAGVGLELGARQERGPAGVGRVEGRGVRRARVADLEQTALGEVALEVGRVHLN